METPPSPPPRSHPVHPCPRRCRGRRWLLVAATVVAAIESFRTAAALEGGRPEEPSPERQRERRAETTDGENRRRLNLFREDEEPAAAANLFRSRHGSGDVARPHRRRGAGLCRSVIAIADARLPPERRGSRGLHGGAGDEGEEEEEEEEEEEGEAFVCELGDGGTVPIRATPEQLGEMRQALNDGTLISAVSTVGVAEEEEVGGEEEEEEEEEGGGLFADAARPPSFRDHVTLPPGRVAVRTDARRRLAHDRRVLLRYSGVKAVLVVRVTDAAGRAPARAAVLSDKIFGTDGDRETMKSQFEACSLGKLRIVNDSYGAVTTRLVRQMAAPGVVDVRIDASLVNDQHVIRDAVFRAVAAKTGVQIPHPAIDHVLIVVQVKRLRCFLLIYLSFLFTPTPTYFVQGCYVDCGWAAYAFVNSWMSLYQGQFALFPAVAMHELGHNLNLAHSGGLNGKTYTDHTCLMGNPLFSDDVGDMCFNPAKTHQIVMTGAGRPAEGNWYREDRITVWDARPGREWSGRLVGIAEYADLGRRDGPLGDARVVLRLVRDGVTDLYVGFNRAVGFNADVVQGADRVTVVEAGGGGTAYAQSFLRAVLGQGESYRVPDWRGAGGELVVTVSKIRRNASPWTVSNLLSGLGDLIHVGARGLAVGSRCFFPNLVLPAVRCMTDRADFCR